MQRQSGQGTAFLPLQWCGREGFAFKWKMFDYRTDTVLSMKWSKAGSTALVSVLAAEIGLLYW